MAWCRSSREDGSLCGLQGYTNAHHAAHNGAVRSNRCAGLAPNPLTPMNASRRPIMVTLAGQPQGWPVPCNAGCSNPVNVTAPIEIATSSGDSLNLLQEAVTMATTLTPSHPLFVWRFWSCQNATYTTTATSEREARLQLPAVRLVFVARIRVEGVPHV
ncbi:host cell division inhibitor Icd-like protein [Salmonella enterica subsp. enterica]|nr:host cell division inhibitor Icd-like protein [Salmonella enterica subsp. enterica]ECI0979629.1 host cell division inhibitor Icd-like protein [Salmonella enterica subsp. enterica serovar Newport]ECO1010819.1 host cell division inhibitor Icd-like protein [Salmonella enterica subsp. enterica serovar Newport]EDQ2989520.1 ash family protein [Salmonella enterica subsp. enterica]EEW6724207.1 ash family protein [Salmonella enterica]